MIIDNIKNADIYYGIHPNVDKLLDFLKSTAFPKTEDTTTYEIDGKKAYASCVKATKRVLDGAQWEAHKLYGDIHFIVDGEELFGYEVADLGRDTWEYNENGDYIFDHPTTNLVKLMPGDFAIVFPKEPHLPVIDKNSGTTVKKVIGKFLMD